jgi:hypothetical protein
MERSMPLLETGGMPDSANLVLLTSGFFGFIPLLSSETRGGSSGKALVERRRSP